MLLPNFYIYSQQGESTYVCRIRGMFTQFAAATAANGTNLPIKGGADCKIKQSKLMVIPNSYWIMGTNQCPSRRNHVGS